MIETMGGAMTPRQRWLATFAGEPVDRQATDYWSTPEFTAKLAAVVTPGEGPHASESLWQALRIDAVRSIGPKRTKQSDAGEPSTDMWGVRYQRINYGTGDAAGVYGEAVFHPLAHAETVRHVDDFSWPSPDDFDYTVVAGQAAAGSDRMIRAGHYEPFLLYCAMRGMEQAFEDLLLNEDVAHAILQHLFDFHHEYNRRIFEAAGRGRVDLFYLAEDLAGQTGPLFSLETYRRFLLPGQTRMASLAHQYGAKVFYHTDGAAQAFVPTLIEEVGIDLLNPLQWRCSGMELEPLVRNFARHIVFHGGIDNQQTLAFGTPDEVRRQVRWAADIMARHKARWICAPCHNIQPVSPVANVLAMYDEATKVRPQHDRDPQREPS